ncbi:MAG: hypothetical protein NC408_00135 [Candidatus Gastranaerophilales bacterium]|nr:hypothetical protein [Candidatus Gastranaerophilales bacterium]MCM1073135.1 hypothetical protein [Bacteroides sp.]
MDRDLLLLEEYKLYAEQKENFIDRNFRTNRFYMISFVIIIFAMIYTGNVVFMERLSATFVFSLIGISVCALWWMNVDSYNTLIKIKYANVIEAIEEKLPVKPFTDEFKGIQEFRENKVFMFSDIQKFIAVLGALFFFAVFVSEASPIVISIINKIIDLLGSARGGI